MNERTPLGAALDLALEASVRDQIGEVRNRIEEECIRARESGEMRQDQFDRAVTQANAAFDTVAKDAICNALRAGDKDAFKGAASKREGLDEGPDLDSSSE